LPYITPNERIDLDPAVENVMDFVNTPGQFCYVVYKMIGMFMKENGLNFHHWAMIRGAIEEAITEYRRRYIRVYEERKKTENGDVTF
jgi:hypothetical protein